MLPEFGGTRMRNLLFALTIGLCIAVGAAGAQTSKKMSSAGAPDKAYLQKIWDGWSTLDPANTAQFYAKGPHTFFDIAPLKYNSWDEYQAGVVKELADYKTAKCTVNDDAQVHPHGDLVWATATVMCDMTRQSGKREMSNFRWTVVFEKQEGKWPIVHEHVSSPIS
jgi:ketosteroid isomerase-like protein